MCNYRRYDVTYPDGREIRLIVDEDRDGGRGCEICNLSIEAFKHRGLPPHDTIQHQEMYYGATVKRGRRLSALEVERLNLVITPPPLAPAPEQLSLLTHGGAARRLA